MEDMLINMAVIEHGEVTNIIVIDQANIERFTAQGWTLAPVEPLGLQIGDGTDGTDFYRAGRKLPIDPDEANAQDYIDALGELGVTV